MKKAIRFYVSMLLCIAVSLAFSSCGEHEHTASDWITDTEATCAAEGARYKECTECGEVLENEKTDKTEEHTEVTDPRVEPTLTETGLTEGSHCSVCGKVFVEQEEIPMLPAKATLTTNSLTIDGLNIIGRFPHFTEAFDFANNIAATNNATWVVSTDVYGMQTVATKTVPLSEGENTFYIHVSNPDQSVSTYTVTLYRNHLYTISFNTNSETSIENQKIEEGLLASKPTDPTRAGYTFVGWDYNFANPISSNIMVNASWNANTDTVYKVEYYLENTDKNGYDLIETLNLTGTTDTTATAEKKTYEHFTFNEANSVMSGNINGGGSLVLKVCYTRNSYTVTSYVNNSNAGTVTSGGTYAYNESTTLTATANIGYTFLGWFDGNDKICDTETFSFNVIVDRNIEARFEVLAEMQGFNFTSTASNCEITSIKDKAATKIVIPDCVTSIAAEAFSYCHYLTSLTIGNGVASIGNSAFLYCESLTAVTIPNSVTSIGEHAFYRCTDLTSVTVGNSVESIGAYAFEYCIGLSAVYIIDVAKWCKISFENYASNPLYYADSLYLNGVLVNELIIPDGVTKIVNYAFTNCKSLTSVDVPSSVISIEDHAFEGCTNLERVDMPNSVTKLGNYVFYNCIKLENVSIPNGVTSIGDYAFYYCKAIMSVNIPNGVTSIGAYAFYNCTSLSAVDLTNSVESIGSYAFAFCYGLTNVTVPSGVTSISGYTFYNCTSLESVIIPSSVTSIGSYAFSGCSNLTSIKYRDTEARWNAISKANLWDNNIGGYTVHYNYTEE